MAKHTVTLTETQETGLAHVASIVNADLEAYLQDRVSELADAYVAQKQAADEQVVIAAFRQCDPSTQAKMVLEARSSVDAVTDLAQPSGIAIESSPSGIKSNG